jgi:hypothetical protein
MADAIIDYIRHPSLLGEKITCSAVLGIVLQLGQIVDLDPWMRAATGGNG